MLKYLFLAGTLTCTVYGQLIIKARSQILLTAPGEAGSYLFRMLTDPMVISGFAAAGVAALCWLLAVRHFDVGYAYPFMALSFVLVPVGGAIWLSESISWAQVSGLALILAGVAINALAHA